MHDGQNIFDEYYAPFGEWGIDESMENLFQNQKEPVIVVGIETSGRIFELFIFYIRLINNVDL